MTTLPRRRPASLKIVWRKTKIVVMHSGRVVFSTRFLLSDCEKFIEGWREGEVERSNRT